MPTGKYKMNKLIKTNTYTTLVNDIADIYNRVIFA